MKKLIYVAMLPLIVFLTACLANNPLIGTWKSEPIMGITSLVEFKNGEMINKSGFGGISNSSEIKVSEYKIEKDKVGVVVEQESTTATMWYTIIDADTIEQDTGMIKVRLHRIK